MPISVVCPNGHKLSAQEKLAGKKVKCPKCQALIQIPPRVEELETLPVLDDPFASTEQPGASQDSGSMGGLPSFDTQDFGNSNELPNSSSVPFGSNSQDPFYGELPAAPMQHNFAYQAPTQPTKSVKDEKKNWPLLIGVGVGGLVAVLVVFGTVGFLLLRGSNKAASHASTPVTKSQEVGPSAPSNAEPTKEPVVSIDNGSTKEPPTITKPAATDLRPIKLDERLTGFDLPGTTWSTAYDASSGHLLVTNDENGILAYDLDDLVEGKPVVKTVIKTVGVPAAVCFKPLGDRRVFIVAGKGSNELQVIDADSLNQTGTVSIAKVSHVDFLTSSENPKDPYLYFSTRNNQDVKGYSYAPIGRINLDTAKEDGYTKEDYVDATISQDGSRVHVRHNSYGWEAEWPELLTKSAGDFSGRQSDSCYYLQDEVVLGNKVFNRFNGLQVGSIKFLAGAKFKKHPITFGISGQGLVFGSSNTWLQHDTIPLPEGWIKRGQDQSSLANENRDFRLRPSIYPFIQSSFCSMKADDKRDLGLLVLGERIVIAPYSKSKVPLEPDLRTSNALPASATVGEKLAIHLETADPNTVFEYIPSLDGFERDSSVEVKPSRQSSEEKRSVKKSKVETQLPEETAKHAAKLTLNAAVNSTQKVLYMAKMDSIGSLRLPFTIQVGDEKMTVLGFDDLNECLTVERTNGTEHSVSSPVYALIEQNSEIPVESKPAIADGKTLEWTPTPGFVGRRNIHLRARSGSVTRDWFWEVDVRNFSPELPFKVVGIEVENGGTQAVVWGQSTVPIQQSNSAMSNATALAPKDQEYFVGVYDVDQRKLLRYEKIAKRITSATIHQGQIVVCVNTPKLEFVRFDAETLKERGKALAPKLFNRLTVIGSKFLFAEAADGNHRFSFPSLEELPKTQLQYNHKIAGRLKDGWVWDGVVWDKEMTKPRLLLFAVHFESSNTHERQFVTSTQSGFTYSFTEGPSVCAWLPAKSISNSLGGQLYLNDYPGSVSQEGLGLRLQSWANSSQRTLDGSQPTWSRTSITVEEANEILRSESMPTLNARNFDTRSPFPSYLAQDDTYLHSATLGKLVSIPKKYLFNEKPLFRFEEKQDTFVLECGKTNKIRYSAPEAVSYEFRLWRYLPSNFQSEPDIFLKSKDGNFELKWDDPQPFIRGALNLVNRFDPDENVRTFQSVESVSKAALNAYSKAITPAFKQLVGKNPKTVYVPVYVMVTAKHEDNIQTAGLVHAYLIEVPAKAMQTKISR